MPSRPEDRPIRTWQKDRLDLEWGAYWIVRWAIAATGGFLLVLFAGGSFLPDHYSSEGPPPTLLERLTTLAVGLAAAVPMFLPNRLTRRGWPFRARLVLLILVGLWGVWIGVSGITAGLRGGKAPAVVTMSTFAIFLGLCVPASLPWRRRLDRITPQAGVGIPGILRPGGAVGHGPLVNEVVDRSDESS